METRKMEFLLAERKIWPWDHKRRQKQCQRCPTCHMPTPGQCQMNWFMNKELCMLEPWLFSPCDFLSSASLLNIYATSFSVLFPTMQIEIKPYHRAKANQLVKKYLRDFSVYTHDNGNISSHCNTFLNEVVCGLKINIVPLPLKNLWQLNRFFLKDLNSHQWWWIF